MHIEVLVEDSSGASLLEILLPQLLGPEGAPHTWRVIKYKGVGRIPKGLTATAKPSHRILLDRLPQLLRGFRNSQGVDAVVVVVDLDSRDEAEFVAELDALARDCDATTLAHFHLAVEEIEAWYLGDREALLAAYPKAKTAVLGRYVQDSICGTWELMADALHAGGAAAAKKAGWHECGELKHEWAAKIGPLISLDRNVSPSFGQFRDGLRRLAARA